MVKPSGFSCCAPVLWCSVRPLFAGSVSWRERVAHTTRAGRIAAGRHPTRDVGALGASWPLPSQYQREGVATLGPNSSISAKVSPMSAKNGQNLANCGPISTTRSTFDQSLAQFCQCAPVSPNVAPTSTNPKPDRGIVRGTEGTLQNKLYFVPSVWERRISFGLSRFCRGCQVCPMARKHGSFHR